MNATAAHVARDVNEFKIAGLTAAPCKLVNVPRVAESPVAFECKVTEIIQLKGANGEKAQAWVTFGEVVAVHIDKAMIKDGVYQTALGKPITRAGRTRRLFRDHAGKHVRDGAAGLGILHHDRRISANPSRLRLRHAAARPSVITHLLASSRFAARRQRSRPFWMITTGRFPCLLDQVPGRFRGPGACRRSARSTTSMMR